MPKQNIKINKKSQSYSSTISQSTCFPTIFLSIPFAGRLSLRHCPFIRSLQSQPPALSLLSGPSNHLLGLFAGCDVMVVRLGLSGLLHSPIRPALLCKRNPRPHLDPPVGRLDLGSPGLTLLPLDPGKELAARRGRRLGGVAGDPGRHRLLLPPLGALRLGLAPPLPFGEGGGGGGGGGGGSRLVVALRCDSRLVAGPVGQPAMWWKQRIHVSHKGVCKLGRKKVLTRKTLPCC